MGVASRLLLKVMTTADLPERIALHGRVSGPASVPAPEAEAADVAAPAAELAATDTAPADTAPADTASADTQPAEITPADTQPAETAAAAGTETPVPASLSPAQLAAAGLADGGRFLENVLVHQPGVELVCGPRLSLQADPYLADYQVDGLPMLPPMLALEALAQAASVLAGRPVRAAAGLRLDSCWLRFATRCKSSRCPGSMRRRSNGHGK